MVGKLLVSVSVSQFWLLYSYQESLVDLLFSSVWRKKVWGMNRSAKGLLIVTTNLDDFSLVNCRQFTKFAKLSTRQTFLLYGN